MIKNIIIILLLILIGFGIRGKWLMWNVKSDTRVITKTKIKEVVVKDTIEIPTPKIVYRDKYAPIKLPLSVQKPNSKKIDSIEVRLPVHIYSDRIEKDSSVFSYNMEVQGYLKHFDYNFKTYTKTITNEKITTHTKHRFLDLYAIGGMATGPYIGADLAFKKYKVGYRLEFRTTPVHHIEIGYRFFDL